MVPGHKKSKSYLQGEHMTKDTNRYLVTKKTQVLPTGWTDDQGYQQVPSYKKPKFYLEDGQTTKDTYKYLVIKIPRLT